MNEETIAEMVQNWINGTWTSGLFHPTRTQLIEQIKAREEWINGNIEGLNKTIYQHLANLNAAEQERDSLRAQLITATACAETAERELEILRRENIDLLVRAAGFEAVANAMQEFATKRNRPKTTEREKINIEPETKEQLRKYLMAQSSSGEGYSEFVAKALEWRKWVDAYRKSQTKVAQDTSPFVSEWKDPRDEDAIFGKDQIP